MGDKDYNGWKNRETRHVMLRINNEYSLYKEAVTFMQKYKGRSPYAHFIKAMGLTDEKTPANIKWRSSLLDYKALNEAMWELKGDN